MAKLYYRYGTMGSGKSLNILAIKKNYEKQNKNAIVITSEMDNRFADKGNVASRMGISAEALTFSKDTDFMDIIMGINENINCILIDECQFLSKRQVDQIGKIVDILKVPVICYGLKTDFMNNLFEGSKRLLEISDKIEEIKTVCYYCDSKATMILKIKNGVPVYSGDQIEIGDNSLYKPVCRKHYHNPDK